MRKLAVSIATVAFLMMSAQADAGMFNGLFGRSSCCKPAKRYCGKPRKVRRHRCCRPVKHYHHHCCKPRPTCCKPRPHCSSAGKKAAPKAYDEPPAPPKKDAPPAPKKGGKKT